MTMLQEKAVQMIQNMSDENVPQKKHIEIIYQSQSVDPNKEKMQAFQELVDTRDDVKKYLPDDFDPDAELEAARKEK